MFSITPTIIFLDRKQHTGWRLTNIRKQSDDKRKYLNGSKNPQKISFRFMDKMLHLRLEKYNLK